MARILVEMIEVCFPLSWPTNRKECFSNLHLWKTGVKSEVMKFLIGSETWTFLLLLFNSLRQVLIYFYLKHFPRIGTVLARRSLFSFELVGVNFWSDHEWTFFAFSRPNSFSRISRMVLVRVWVWFVSGNEKVTALYVHTICTVYLPQIYIWVTDYFCILQLSCWRNWRCQWRRCFRTSIGEWIPSYPAGWN